METVVTETEERGSYFHSCVQANLTALLMTGKQFRVLTELSLAINGTEYKPDLSLYTKDKQGVTGARDIIKMTEMPLGVVEILSPSQRIDLLFDKFDIYFQAGVLSCWFVLPSMKTISIYLALDAYQVFHEAETLKDKCLDISVLVDDVFV
jgi:Uma2 family endonuclease